MNGLSVLDETPRRGEMEERTAYAAGDASVIKFKASVWKVGSLGGGGLRVQLNLDQAYIRQMAMLAECQHDPEMELEFEARQSRD